MTAPITPTIPMYAMADENGAEIYPPVEGDEISARGVYHIETDARGLKRIVWERVDD